MHRDKLRRKSPGSSPGLGRSPGEGNGNPLQYYCLENPTDRGAWYPTVYGVAKSWTRLSNFTFTMDCSLPGSYVHAIFLARILEWVPCPPAGYLPNPGIEPSSLTSPALAGGFFITAVTWEAPPIPKCRKMLRAARTPDSTIWLQGTQGFAATHDMCYAP